MIKARHDLEKKLLDMAFQLEESRGEILKLKQPGSTLPIIEQQKENHSRNPGSSASILPQDVFDPLGSKSAAKVRHKFLPQQVFCLFEADQNYYSARVTKRNSDGTAHVVFTDYGEQEWVVPETHILKPACLTHEERVELLKIKREKA